MNKIQIHIFLLSLVLHFMALHYFETRILYWAIPESHNYVLITKRLTITSRSGRSTFHGCALLQSFRSAIDQ